MSDAIISIRNVSKIFAGGHDGGFQALKDVSFDVKKGDAISIIGNNGSGKTTLLKIISGITHPSAGEVLLYGTSTSILDIGGNFHPDLTGRENVLLQLKLAGKEATDIQKHVDEIAGFSEIGAFFDRPVKHYSSGMFLRLAFSLAFHIASDILILDEVLSVGDEGFRLKCQELLRRFADSGRTIVFVSHSRQEILDLSNTCIWLEKGEIKKTGPPAELLGEYFAGHMHKHERKKKVVQVNDIARPEQNDGLVLLRWTAVEAPQDDYISIREVSVASAVGKARIYNTDPITLRFTLQKKVKHPKIGAFFFLQDIFYQPVMVAHMLNNSQRIDMSESTADFEGMMTVSCVIPPDYLMPGTYYLQLRFGMTEKDWDSQSQELFRFFEKLSFTVHPVHDHIDIIGDVSKGSFRPRLDWSLDFSQDQRD